MHIKAGGGASDVEWGIAMKTTPTLILAAASLAVLLGTGCGRSDSSSASTAATQPTAAAPAAKVNAPAEGRAIAVTANDAMKFDVTEITAHPGEALAVTLTNNGTMPKFSMGHNWVLLAANVDVNAFAMDAAQAVKTDYVPAAATGQVLAATRLLGPKESDTVLFYAPKQPGRYVFLCTFPGHFQVGMKGILVVQ